MALDCRVATLLAMTDFAVASYHGRLGLFIDRPRAAGAPRLFHSGASALSLGVSAENSAECTISDSRLVFA